MATFVRCLKCGQIIECSPYDSSILMDHIRIHHPEIIKNIRMSSTNPNDDPLSTVVADGERTSPIAEPLLPLRSSSLREHTIYEGGRQTYTRKYKVRSPLTPRSPQRRRMYRTSVEKWRPAKGTIYCPKCGANKRPIIKSRSEKMSYSAVGAACILTCWPMCFLPCLFPAAARDFLHCAECNNFLGMYDKNNNCVRPNREFVEGGDGCQGSPPDESLARQSDKIADENYPERRSRRSL